MCLPCGGFVAASHWTDRYVEDEARDRGADDGGYARERRRDRAHRAALANEVLKHYGLGVKDWGGSKYVFTNGKGASELVGDLGSLWPAAARLAGRPLDPLDPVIRGRLLATAALGARNGRTTRPRRAPRTPGTSGIPETLSWVW